MSSLKGGNYDAVGSPPPLSRGLCREAKAGQGSSAAVGETQSAGRSQWILTKLRGDRHGIY